MMSNPDTANENVDISSPPTQDGGTDESPPPVASEPEASPDEASPNEAAAGPPAASENHAVAQVATPEPATSGDDAHSTATGDPAETSPTDQSNAVSHTSPETDNVATDTDVSERTDAPPAEDRQPERDERAPPRNAAGIPRDAPLPTMDGCLAALYAMPGLVSLGMLATAQASALTRIYATILQNLQRRDSSRHGEARLNDERVLALLQANPDLLSLIEPLLTPDQIDLIVRSAGDDPLEPAEGTEHEQT